MSCMLVQMVIPMLPHILCNKVCRYTGGTDRSGTFAFSTSIKCIRLSLVQCAITIVSLEAKVERLAFSAIWYMNGES